MAVAVRKNTKPGSAPKKASTAKATAGWAMPGRRGGADAKGAAAEKRGGQESFWRSLVRRFTQPKVALSDLLFFTTQLTVMIETGSQLTQCLAALGDQTDDKALRKAINSVKNDVKEGKMLSKALARFPSIFDGVYVSMIRAGERGGSLAHMLERLVVVLEKRESLRNSLKGAMRYPMVLLGISALVMLVLVTFLLPKFKTIFEGMGADLPLPTTILMGASDFVLGYWYVLIGVAALFVIGSMAFYHNPSGRRIVDDYSLKLPMYGDVRKTVFNAMILRLLGTLIEAGVPLLEALQITKGTMTNVRYTELLQRVIDRLSQGTTFSTAIGDTDLIPAITKQMIRTGENAGMLGRVMIKVADYYDRIVDVRLGNLGKIIEPIMIVFMGGMVGGVAMSLMLPIFKMSTSVPH